MAQGRSKNAIDRPTVRVIRAEGEFLPLPQFPRTKSLEDLLEEITQEQGNDRYREYFHALFLVKPEL